MKTFKHIMKVLVSFLLESRPSAVLQIKTLCYNQTRFSEMQVEVRACLNDFGCSPLYGGR